MSNKAEIRILMVCLGNICRSPLAEGIMQHIIDHRKLNWLVASAGTSGYHNGDAPDSRSIDVAHKYGIDITHQRSAQFFANDFDQYDYICAMDSSNYQNILRLARNESDKAKVHMIMNFSRPGQNTNVIDPYYGEEGFENVFHMLNEACEAMVNTIGET